MMWPGRASVQLAAVGRTRGWSQARLCGSGGASVRARETEFYSQIDDWWSPTGPQAQLHKFNPVRIKFIQRALRRQPGGVREAQVLDVGCGAGLLSEGLARMGVSRVTGVDPTAKCVELAQAHLDQAAPELQRRVGYRHGSVEQLVAELSPDSRLFDLVCCSEVLEHVEDHRAFLHQCARLVRPGGLLFVSSIAQTPEAWLINVLMGEYVLGVVPRGTHEWKYLIKQDRAEQHLAELGCRTIAASGAAVVNPMSMEMAEIPYLRGNYLMMSKKPNDDQDDAGR